MTLCINCFREQEEENAICTECGFDKKQGYSSLFLPPGTKLQGKYIIGKVLGVPGGFGVTYLGYNETLQTIVAIKEYLPRDFAGRSTDGITINVHADSYHESFQEGISQFLEEARKLARFNHPNIVRVFDFFEENGTAYLVMEYYQGVNLVEYIKLNGGYLQEQHVLKIMLPLFDGLQQVHACGILHRDVKPQNIYIATSGQPILLDFGAARESTVGKDCSLSVMMTPGFAPYEQYHKKGKQGPWTDVYGCAATIFYMLTGEIPPDAIERITEERLVFPAKMTIVLTSEIKTAIMKALAIMPENRVQSIEEFSKLLLNETIKMPRVNIPITQKRNDIELMIQTDSKDDTACQMSPACEVKVPFYQQRASMVAITAVVLVVTFIGYWLYQQHYNPINVLNKKGIPYTEDAFFNAIKTGDESTINLFFAAGMNANQTKQDTGETPAIIATEAGQIISIKLLISHGSDLLLQDQKGRTAVNIAIKQGNIEILKLLMNQLKLTPDTKDSTGQTLMEKACASGNITSVKFFIEQGGDINILDSQGNTILDRMLVEGKDSIAQVLKNAGAKRNVNKNFKLGQLNQVQLPFANQTSFEVDLLGDGVGEKVTINKEVYPESRSTVTISKEDKMLTSFSVYGGTYEWYVTYLRDDNIPDLVYFFRAGSGAFINDFKIIGQTGKDTIGLIYDRKNGLFVNDNMAAGGAKLSIEGKRLVINTKKGRAAIEWKKEGGFFRVWDLN